MTADKLWGAGAAFLMTGVLWAYLYAIVEHYYPRPSPSAECRRI